MNDKKSCLMRMKVFDLIDHELFFTADSLRRQPTISQSVQPLSPQMSALVACSYSLCAVWVCHRREGYRDVFSRTISRKVLPFHGNTIELLLTALHHSSIPHGGLLHTPAPPPSSRWRSSAGMGALQSPSALLSLDCPFDISFSAPQTPLWPRLGAPLFHSRPFTSLPLRWCSVWMAAPLDRRCSITFRAPPSTSALLFPTLHSTSGTPPVLLAHRFFLRIHPIAFQTPFWFTASKPLKSDLLDITNRAKRHWNSIPPTRQARIIRK